MTNVCVIWYNSHAKLDSSALGVTRKHPHLKNKSQQVSCAASASVAVGCGSLGSWFIPFVHLCLVVEHRIAA